jgi:succinate dehydrogenase flavin-adding protein (antitoxin of CptAB toxin-antitoxin module)
LEQCDQLLNSLQWDAQRGRQLLEQHFRLNSRQQLSDEQLLQFNMLLEEALMTAGHI